MTVSFVPIEKLFFKKS